MQDYMVKRIKDILEAGIERAKRGGASAAKIGFGHSESVSATFESGRLKTTGSVESFNFAIDIVKNGRRSIASGNRIEHLNDMIDKTLEFTKTGGVAHFSEYPAPKEYVKVKSYSKKVLDYSRERMIEDCGKVVDAMKTVADKLNIHASAGRSEGEGLTLTSGGLEYENKSTSWSLGSWVQRTDGTDILSCGYGRGWGDMNEYYDIDAIIKRITWELKNSLKIVEAPTGKIKAFFNPDSTWMLFSPIYDGMSGRSVYKGDSPLKGKLNQQIISPDITIVDNPHIDFGGSEIDGSGIPTRKQTLIENGVLQRYLYDLDTAGLADAQPTGNEGCGVYNPIINRGKRSSAEMLKGIEDGIYILSPLGYGQGNIMNGDISCNIGLGYRIMNGEIVGRVKDTMMAGNTYDLCKRIELSSDSDYLGFSPYAIINDLSVTTRK